MAMTPKDRALRKKWRERSDDTRPFNPAKDGKVHLKFLADLITSVIREEATASGIPIDPPDAPDVLRCHFCRVVVDASVATFGRCPTILRTKHLTVNEDTGEPEIEEKKLHRQSKVVACPKHALEIKPTVTRDICPNCSGTKMVVRDGQQYGCLRCAKPNRQGQLVPSGRVDGSVRSNIYITSREEAV